MPRYCLLNHVDPSRLDEYKARHRAVWPELLRALVDAGWQKYSLFLGDDGLLVGYVESDDLDAAQAKVAATEINERWQQAMAPFFVGTGEANPDTRWERLDEIFDLGEQLRAAPEPS